MADFSKIQINNVSYNVKDTTARNSIAATDANVTTLTSKVDTFNTNINTVGTNVASLSSRMDAFSSLPSGSTTGDAELIDARIAYDGESSSSAGTSIRAQTFNNFHLAEDVYSKIVEDNYEDVTPAVSASTLIQTNGNTSSSGGHIEVNVNPGDVLWIGGYRFSGGYPFYFFKNGSTLIQSSENKGYTTNNTEYTAIVTAPVNASKLYVNGRNVTTPGVIFARRLTKIPSGKDVQLLTDMTFTNMVESNVTVVTNKVINPANLAETSIAGGMYAYMPVKPNQRCELAGYQYGDAFRWWFVVDSNNTLIAKADAYDTNTYHTDTIVMPTGAATLYINGYARMRCYIKTVDSLASRGIVNGYKDKKIVWLGTSIPATKPTYYHAYPTLVGEMLQANVVNEAVGSSPVCCKRVQRIDATRNPYGFHRVFTACSRCLTNTLIEMQWLIDNYNATDASGNPLFIDAPSSISSEQAEFMRNCSYERKIDSHLTAGDVDLWVFDHGHNDRDFDQNVVGNVTKTDEEMMDLYGEYNLYTWQGACNFLFHRIYNADNNAKIVMIGEYNNKYPMLPVKQKQVADDWCIPIYDQWNRLGWNASHTITTTGYWDYDSSNNAYTWVPSGGTSREITLHDRFIPDGVHPSSDSYGDAVKLMATRIAKWLMTISPVE